MEFSGYTLRLLWTLLQISIRLHIVKVSKSYVVCCMFNIDDVGKVNYSRSFLV